MKNLILCSVFLAVGCSGTPDMSEVRISPDCTPEETKAISEAVESWVDVFPELERPILVTSDSPNVFCLDEVPDEYPSTARGSFGEGYVELYRSNLKGDLVQLRATMAHEYGHAMHPEAEHCGVEGSLMHSDRGMQITDADILWMADSAQIRAIEE